MGGASKKAYETAADQDREIRRGGGERSPQFFLSALRAPPLDPPLPNTEKPEHAIGV